MVDGAEIANSPALKRAILRSAAVGMFYAGWCNVAMASFALILLPVEAACALAAAALVVWGIGLWVYATR